MTATGALTITDFLLARIAEDEQAVYYWDSDGPDGAVVATVWTGEGPGYTTVAASSVEGVWVADGHEVEDPRHVHMLFDPARVLAECGAKRAIVEREERGLRDAWLRRSAEHMQTWEAWASEWQALMSPNL